MFDFDGTLVESNDLKRQAYFEVFAEHPDGADVLAQILRDHPGEDRYGIIGKTRDRLHERGDRELPVADALTTRYGRICEQRVSTCPAVPGAVTALEELTRHYPLYLDSATPEPPLRRVVTLRGWTHFFRDIFGGPTGKADNLRRIAHRESLSPNSVLLVGDQPADRQAALDFGCSFAGFETSMPELAEHPRLAALAPLARELFQRSKSQPATTPTG